MSYFWYFLYHFHSHGLSKMCHAISTKFFIKKNARASLSVAYSIIRHRQKDWPLYHPNPDKKEIYTCKDFLAYLTASSKFTCTMNYSDADYCRWILKATFRTIVLLTYLIQASSFKNSSTCKGVQTLWSYLHLDLPFRRRSPYPNPLQPGKNDENR